MSSLFCSGGLGRFLRLIYAAEPAPGGLAPLAPLRPGERGRPRRLRCPGGAAWPRGLGPHREAPLAKRLLLGHPPSPALSPRLAVPVSPGPDAPALPGPLRLSARRPQTA